MSASPVSAAQLGAIVGLIGEGTISGKIAKDLFEIVWNEGGDPRALVESRGMKQVTDLSAIEKVVDGIMSANPDKVAQAKAKPAAMQWFVGQTMKATGGKADPKAVNELFGRLNKEGHGISDSPVSAAQLAAIVGLIGEGTISGKIAKDLFEIVWTEGGDPRELVEARGMKQVTDLGAIEKVVDDIIAANPDKVAQAKAKPQLASWFVGQVMKQSGGKANPQAVNDLLKAKLGI